jgi:hypothetical protein
MAKTILRSAIVCAAVLAALPAFAQFGTIFGDPPRPPRDVPSRQTPPSQEAPTQVAPTDEPDEEDRLPPPTNLPPSRRPSANTLGGTGGGIRSQPLAPPQQQQQTQPLQQPQQPAQQQQPQQQQQAAPAQALPGLPPGQRQPRGAPPQQANTDPQPGDEIVAEPSENKLVNPTAVFSGLDKITGRTISFDVAINETVQFGALQVTPRACYSRPPTEAPRTDAFVSVDEVTLQGEVRRIFTGWMFASSPGLHAVEHPIYDVWLSDCKGATPPVAEAPEAPKPAAQQQPPRRRTNTPPPNQPRAQQQPGFLPALR